jgi:hypothetical protein
LSKTNKPSLVAKLAPDFLLCFSFAWVSFSIFFWEIQKVPIFGLHGVIP